MDEDCEDVTKCDVDEFLVTAATSSSDAVCSSCENENTYNDPVTKTCKDVTECQAGTYEAAAPTGTSDRICKVMRVVLTSGISCSSCPCVL